MKLSNEKLMNSIEVLSQLSKKSLPVKTSYIVAKNIANLEKFIRIYGEEKQKLLDRYSTRDEDGKIIEEDGMVSIDTEYVEDWKRDIEELQNIENEIDIQQFNIEDLTGEMAPIDLLNIDYMILE